MLGNDTLAKFLAGKYIVVADYMVVGGDDVTPTNDPIVTDWIALAAHAFFVTPDDAHTWAKAQGASYGTYIRYFVFRVDAHTGMATYEPYDATAIDRI